MRKILYSNRSVFAVALLVHGLAVAGGPKLSPDVSLYLKLTDGFLRGGEIFSSGAVLWTKITYLFALGAARSVAPDRWMYLMVALNVLCSAATATMLVSVVRRATGSAIASAAALLLYLGCYEVVLWLRFPITDLLYTALAFLPFLLVAQGILGNDHPRRRLWLAGALVLASFTRPPGVLLVPLCTFAEWMWVRRPASPGLRRVVIAAGALALLATLAVRTWIVHDPGRWPFAFVRPKIEHFAAREKTGEVVHMRSETMRRPAVTMGDHYVIQADRFVRFFQVTSSAYSRGHNLLNLVYLVPLYLLGLVGLTHALRSGDGRRSALALAAFLWIGGFAFLHALTILDYDWRFRAPLMPHFVVLAALGVDAILRAILARRHQRAAVAST